MSRRRPSLPRFELAATAAAILAPILITLVAVYLGGRIVGG